MAQLGIDVSGLQNAYAQLGAVNAKKRAEKDAAENKKRSGISAITTTAGTIIGGIYGGPAGAAAGGAIGGAVGGMVGGNAMTGQEAAQHGARIYAASESGSTAGQVDANAKEVSKGLARYEAPGMTKIEKANESVTLGGRANEANDAVVASQGEQEQISAGFAGGGDALAEADEAVAAAQKELDQVTSEGYKGGAAMAEANAAVEETQKALNTMSGNPGAYDENAMSQLQKAHDAAVEKRDNIAYALKGGDEILGQAKQTYEEAVKKRDGLAGSLKEQEDRYSAVGAKGAQFEEAGEVVKADQAKVDSAAVITEPQRQLNSWVESQKKKVATLQANAKKGGPYAKESLKKLENMKVNSAYTMSVLDGIPDENKQSFLMAADTALASDPTDFNRIVKAQSGEGQLYDVFDAETGKVVSSGVTQAASVSLTSGNSNLRAVKYGQNEPVTVRNAKKNAQRLENNNLLASYSTPISDDPTQRQESIGGAPKLTYVGGKVPTDKEISDSSAFSSPSPTASQATAIQKRRAVKNTKELDKMKETLSTEDFQKEINRRQNYAAGQDAALDRFTSMGEQTGIHIAVPKAFENSRLFGAGNDAGTKGREAAENAYAEKYVPLVTDRMLSKGGKLTINELENTVDHLNNLPGKTASKAYKHWSKKLEKRKELIYKREENAGKEKARKWQVGTTLRNEHTQLTKGYNDIRSKMDAVRISADNGGKFGGVSDMSLIFAYMKMLDPTSTVREGEYMTAKEASGVSARVANQWNKAVKLFKTGKMPTGEMFTPEVRQKYAGMAKKLWDEGYKNIIDEYDSKYTYLAEEAGIPVGWVIGKKGPEKPAAEEQTNAPPATQPAQEPDDDINLLNKYLKK